MDRFVLQLLNMCHPGHVIWLQEASALLVKQRQLRAELDRAIQDARAARAEQDRAARLQLDLEEAQVGRKGSSGHWLEARSCTAFSILHGFPAWLQSELSMYTC